MTRRAVSTAGAPAAIARSPAGRPAPRDRSGGPGDRHRPGLDRSRADRPEGPDGPGATAPWRARWPACSGRMPRAAAGARDPRTRSVRRAGPRRSGRFPCVHSDTSGPWPPQPIPPSCPDGSRCRHPERRFSARCRGAEPGRNGRDVRPRPCTSAPACGMRCSSLRRPVPDDGDGMPRRSAREGDSARRRRRPPGVCRRRADRGSPCR